MGTGYIYPNNGLKVAPVTVRLAKKATMRAGSGQRLTVVA